MGKYKVCVYAICKNEESFVDRWMDSMNEADLVVVTDTGSTDGTVEKLRERGAVVYVDEIKPWRFDVARNVSLDHVPEDVDICICTDLDEILESGWREKLEEAWTPSATQGKYLYNWSLNADGTPNITFTYFKVHIREGFRWVYPIHEIIRYFGTKPHIEVFIPGMVLNHYPDDTKSRGSYLPLLEMAVEENPEDDRMVYYLGREYMYKGKWNECITTLKKHLNLKSATWREERCASMRWIASSYTYLGQLKEAYKWYYKAIAELPTMREPYIEFAKLAMQLKDWPTVFGMALEALKIKEKSKTYINMGYTWDHTPNDLVALSSYYLGMYDRSLEHAKLALAFNPNDERLKNNLLLIENKISELNKPKRLNVETSNRLVHTLLCLFRNDRLAQDKELATSCLKSLEKSTYKTVVVYNQGTLSNEELTTFLEPFQLNCKVIGGASNVGTTIGRQACFEYVFENYKECEYVSELHLDMLFTNHWEDALVDYLDLVDEPMVSCGIIDQTGEMKFINQSKDLIDLQSPEFDTFLESLKTNKIVRGFTNPCIHKVSILKETGGYNAKFLKGKQCFEDDSMLLGYYYYYGTRYNWQPKVNYNSVVYHAVAGQRLELNDSVMINYHGLVKQYGAMGLKQLSELHVSPWHIQYFMDQYNKS